MAILLFVFSLPQGLKGVFRVQPDDYVFFVHDKTAKHRLVEDHERWSKDGQRKTTTDGEI